jgi:hypothetical protein
VRGPRLGAPMWTCADGMVSKVISGGQTGVDRAALDVAIELGIPHGGWVPKGRKAEDGILPRKYHLSEMPTASYARRTEQNVLDSDGSLILSHGELKGGSDLTRKLAIRHGRPWLRIDLNKTPVFESVKTIQTWLLNEGIRVLNVGGPRGSEDPDIYRETANILRKALSPIEPDPDPT